jgi:hypothetical protein
VILCVLYELCILHEKSWMELESRSSGNLNFLKGCFCAKRDTYGCYPNRRAPAATLTGVHVCTGRIRRKFHPQVGKRSSGVGDTFAG